MYEVVVVNMQITDGVRYEQCRSIVALQVKCEGNEPQAIEIWYPIQGDKHLVSLMKYTNSLEQPWGRRGPDHDLNRAIAAVLAPMIQELEEYSK